MIIGAVHTTQYTVLPPPAPGSSLMVGSVWGLLLFPLLVCRQEHTRRKAANVTNIKKHYIRGTSQPVAEGEGVALNEKFLYGTQPNQSMCADRSTDTKQISKKNLSHVMCHGSCVMYHLSPTTCHLSRARTLQVLSHSLCTMRFPTQTGFLFMQFKHYTL